MKKYLKRLCNAILDGRFNEHNYSQRKSYYGVEIQVTPLFASYGEIGFTVQVYAEEQYTVKYDYELKDLTINERPYQHVFNLLYLEANGIRKTSEDSVWENFPDSVELECRTEAGGDMIINLEEPTKEELQNYIDDFDINEEVLLWWFEDSRDRGVPFSNIRDHYNDYEDYLKWLQKICDKMPY